MQPNYMRGYNYNPNATNTPQNNYMQNPNYNPQPSLTNFQAPYSRPSYIPGRIVSDQNEITVQEVPMDGSISLFMKNDLSCIYAKQWSGNGSIATVRYIPEETNEPNKKQVTMETIMEKLENLERAINRGRPQNYKKRYDNSQGKTYNEEKGKEVTENE